MDPAKPITTWSLSSKGLERVQNLARSGALAKIRYVFSSPETKALETAAPLAEAIGCDYWIDEALHENDRTATGYLPSAEFERAAEQFFSHPDLSFRGWETAKSAQHRIVESVRRCLRKCDYGDALFVGHGGVGTLLYCHLSGFEISRAHDQGTNGGGCYFSFSAPEGRPRFPWRPLEWLCEEGDHDIVEGPTCA